MNAAEALSRCMQLEGVSTVLDIGSGKGVHADKFRSSGYQVDTVSLKPSATYISDYLELDFPLKYDLIWACHVLEHQVNPGLFLEKCYRDLDDDGWLVVTVPPMKPEIVGGHVTLWNAGLLLYHLILAGFDCSDAMVKTYGYNISVIVQKRPFVMPKLVNDCGDIEKLSQFFPFPAEHGFHGEIKEINWRA